MKPGDFLNRVSLEAQLSHVLEPYIGHTIMRHTYDDMFQDCLEFYSRHRTLCEIFQPALTLPNGNIIYLYRVPTTAPAPPIMNIQVTGTFEV